MVADHQIALVAASGRRHLWIDGGALDLAVLELAWSTGDWSSDHAPTCRFVAGEPQTGQVRYSLEYPDPSWPRARIDPTYDGIDHDMDDLLYFIARAADREWAAFYLAHLESGLDLPAS